MIDQFIKGSEERRRTHMRATVASYLAETSDPKSEYYVGNTENVLGYEWPEIPRPIQAKQKELIKLIKEANEKGE